MAVDRSISMETVPAINLLPRPSTEIVWVSGPSLASIASLALRHACHSDTVCQGSSLCPASASRAAV